MNAKRIAILAASAALAIAIAALVVISGCKKPALPAKSCKPFDEASLMARIHELGSSDPELSLLLAREGNERYPNSPDAVKRMWVIVKALSELGRSEEARREALIMVQKHPNNNLTGDVRRHVLSNPPTHPSERGYGKKYEQNR
jgi:hypothetical protein